MRDTGGYPANRRRASAANNFTPALNNITGNRPSKGPSLVFKLKPAKKWNPKPGYKPSNGIGVGY